MRPNMSREGFLMNQFSTFRAFSFLERPCFAIRILRAMVSDMFVEALAGHLFLAEMTLSTIF